MKIEIPFYFYHFIVNRRTKRLLYRTVLDGFIFVHFYYFFFFLERQIERGNLRYGLVPTAEAKRSDNIDYDGSVRHETDGNTRLHHLFGYVDHICHYHTFVLFVLQHFGQNYFSYLKMKNVFLFKYRF